MNLPDITSALMTHMPPVLRVCGAVAKQLRRFNIALAGKSSGSALTDALTLADLTVQEIIVAALRDADPIFRTCRIEAEEENGDLERFSKDSPFTIAIDPIDGTKQYRDRTGNGYCCMLSLRSVETLHYSLVFVPEMGDFGNWVQAVGNTVVCGPDDPSRTATDVLRNLPAISRYENPRPDQIYLIGFQNEDAEKARLVSQTGLRGVAPDDMPGSIYDLIGRGEFAGSLIHTPNVYDFPVSLQMCRIMGGDSIWVHNSEKVNFSEFWLDDRADMLRLPGIVATSPYPEVLAKLAALAKDWNPIRYRDN
jgi:3'(2'), 5'-bisphosphate nucleotidase